MARKKAKRNKESYSFSVPSSSANEGTSRYSIDLDQLDLALLPIEGLLEKFRGNLDSEAAPLWQPQSPVVTGVHPVLDQDSTECRPFIVHAEKDSTLTADINGQGTPTTSRPERLTATDSPPSTVPRTQCHICTVEVLTDYLAEHNRSEGHLALLRLANAALKRLNMYTEQLIDKMMHGTGEVKMSENQNQMIDVHYCVPCNVTIDKLSRETHDSEPRHKRLVRKNAKLTELCKVYMDNVIDETDADSMDDLVTLNVGGASINGLRTVNTSSSSIDGLGTATTDPSIEDLETVNTEFPSIDDCATVRSDTSFVDSLKTKTDITASIHVIPSKTYSAIVQDNTRKPLETSSVLDNQTDHRIDINKLSYTSGTDIRDDLPELKSTIEKDLTQVNAPSLKRICKSVTASAWLEDAQNDENTSETISRITENDGKPKTEGSTRIKSDKRETVTQTQTQTLYESKDIVSENGQAVEKILERPGSSERNCDMNKLPTKTNFVQNDDNTIIDTTKSKPDEKAVTSYHCTVCQMTFPYHVNTIIDHNKGKKHRMQVAENRVPFTENRIQVAENRVPVAENEEKKLVDESKNVKQSIESKNATQALPYYCTVCQKYIPNNINNINDHNKGKKHMMQVADDGAKKLGATATASLETKSSSQQSIKEKNDAPTTSANQNLNMNMPKKVIQTSSECGILTNTSDITENNKADFNTSSTDDTRTHTPVVSKVVNKTTASNASNASKDAMIHTRLEMCHLCELDRLSKTKGKLSAEHLGSYEHKWAVKKTFGFLYDIVLIRTPNRLPRGQVSYATIHQDENVRHHFMEMKKLLAKKFVMLTTRDNIRLPIALSNWHGLVSDEKKMEYKCTMCNNQNILELGNACSLHLTSIPHYVKVIQSTQDAIRQVSTDKYLCVVCNVITNDPKGHLRLQDHKKILEKTSRSTYSAMTIVSHEEEMSFSFGYARPSSQPVEEEEPSMDEPVSQTSVGVNALVSYNNWDQVNNSSLKVRSKSVTASALLEDAENDENTTTETGSEMTENDRKLKKSKNVEQSIESKNATTALPYSSTVCQKNVPNNINNINENTVKNLADAVLAAKSASQQSIKAQKVIRRSLETKRDTQTSIETENEAKKLAGATTNNLKTKSSQQSIKTENVNRRSIETKRDTQTSIETENEAKKLAAATKTLISLETKSSSQQSMKIQNVIRRSLETKSGTQQSIETKTVVQNINKCSNAVANVSTPVQQRVKTRVSASKTIPENLPKMKSTRRLSIDEIVHSYFETCYLCRHNMDLSREHLKGWQHMMAVEMKYDLKYDVQSLRGRRSYEVVEWNVKRERYMEYKKEVAKLDSKRRILVITRDGLKLPVRGFNYHGCVADDMNMEYKCTLCNNTFATELDETIHLMSVKHQGTILRAKVQDAVRELSDGTYHCIVCNVICHDRRVHLRLQEHKSLLEKTSRVEYGHIFFYHPEEPRSWLSKIVIKIENIFNILFMCSFYILVVLFLYSFIHKSLTIEF